MPADPALIHRLSAVLEDCPGLRLAILFGSAAKGTTRADSDVDVAILPEDPEWALAAELSLAVALTAACGREVDVVRLDRAPTIVKWQVVRDGVLLLERGEFARARFVAAATSEYLEFAPAFAWAGERFRRRLAEGRPVRS